MPIKSALKTRLSHTVQLLGTASLFVFSSQPVVVAQSKAPSVAPPTSQAAQISDPTKPEIQPRLDVDRDPIPSPDREEVPATTNASSTANAAKVGDVQKAKNGMYTLHTNVDEVLLNCSVIDEHGHTVDDLKQSDFRVWEDGIEQTVNSVVHEDTPVSMGILIDNSGSMRDKRSAVNVAAYQLLKDSNPRDAAFVVNFSERAYLDQGFTSDLVSLNRSLSRNDSHGTTAMYDALAASADELVKHAKDRKQALLIITDGADNASHLTLAKAVRRVQNLGGPVVYTIGLLFDVNDKEAADARNALESLSQETGGIAYFPRSVSDLDEIAAEVAHDIRNQYVVDYRSTKSASLGGYRTVHVEVKAPGHGKLFVRTKKGYFAQPTQPSQVTRVIEP